MFRLDGTYHLEIGWIEHKDETVCCLELSLWRLSLKIES